MLACVVKDGVVLIVFGLIRRKVASFIV